MQLKIKLKKFQVQIIVMLYGDKKWETLAASSDTDGFCLNCRSGENEIPPIDNHLVEKF